ncbi:MAG: lipopolysaccharide biosynthesis protein [Spirosomataceae bacterium]
MGIIGKQTIQSTVLVYLGIGLGFVTVGVLMPNVFTPAQNGLLSVLISYSVIVASLGQLGFNATTIRFFPHFRNSKRAHHGFLWLSSLVALAGGVVFVGGLYLLKPLLLQTTASDAQLLAHYFWTLAPLAFFQLGYAVFDNYLRMLYDTVTGTFLKEFLMKLLMLCTVALYGLQQISFDTYLLLWVTWVGLMMVFIMLKLKAMDELSFRSDWLFLKQHRPLLNEMTHYSAFALFAGMAGIFLLHVEPIVVQHYLGFAATGIFKITSVFGVVIFAPSKMLYRISATVLADAWKENQRLVIQDVYRKSAINQTIIGTLVLVGILSNLHNVFQWLPAVYQAGYWVIVLYGISGLLDMSIGTGSLILGTSRYYRYETLLVLTLLVVSVSLYVLLIPKFGIIGCAVASLCGIVVINTGRGLVIWTKFQMQPYSWKHLWVLGIGAVTFGLVHFLPVFQIVIIDLIVRSVCITMLFVSLAYRLNVSNELNQQLEKVRRWLKNLSVSKNPK